MREAQWRKLMASAGGLGLRHQRADLAGQLLASAGRRFGIVCRFTQLPRRRTGKALDLADQMRLVIKGVAELRQVWQSALRDVSPGVNADEVIARLERKYQTIADAKDSAG